MPEFATLPVSALLKLWQRVLGELNASLVRMTKACSRRLSAAADNRRIRHG
jgi:hypothetical protein